MANRHFRIFSTNYMYVIMRRFFYFDLHTPQEIPKEWITPQIIENVRNWFEHTVCESLGEDGFNQLYLECCDDAYNFPGDTQWYGYIYPARPSDIVGSVLQELRPHLQQDYFMEFRVSKAPVVNALLRDDLMGKLSRSFFFRAVGHYVETKYDTHWYNGVVIRNTSLERSANKLALPYCPYLIQIFSRYWLYDKGCIWVSDNIYEILAIWMYKLVADYDSLLFGSDLSPTLHLLLQNSPIVQREIIEI
jgi:hypothetical protein